MDIKITPTMIVERRKDYRTRTSTDGSEIGGPALVYYRLSDYRAIYGDKDPMSTTLSKYGDQITYWELYCFGYDPMPVRVTYL